MPLATTYPLEVLSFAAVCLSSCQLNVISNLFCIHLCAFVFILEGGPHAVQAYLMPCLNHYEFEVLW